MLNSIFGNQKNEILLTVDKISITSLLPGLYTEVDHPEVMYDMTEMQLFPSGGGCRCMTLTTCSLVV